MIRVSTAHAKARLSLLVEEVDAAAAIDLLQFALYHETGVDAGARFATNDDDEASDDDENVDPASTAAHEAAPASGKRGRGKAAADDEAADELEAGGQPAEDAAASGAATAPGQPRYESIKDAVTAALGDLEELEVASLMVQVAPGLSASEAELVEVLRVMENENLIMYSETTIFRV